MSNLIVGIDLGTTNSAAAVFIKDQLKVLENREGDYTTPSFVYFVDGVNLSIGKYGKLHAIKKPEHGIYEMKRLIGRQFYEVEQYLSNLPYKVINKEQEPYVYLEKHRTYISPEEIVSYLLKKIQKDVSTKLGKPVTKAVVTVPAHFSVSQRRATLEAAKKSGIQVIKLLNEPTAAALNYYYDNNDINPEKKISLVYDLGGGTFDVAVLERNGQNIDIMSIDGDSHLGGHDFDALIKDYVVQEMGKTYNLNIRQDHREIRRLMTACTKGKEMLSVEKLTLVIMEGFMNQDVIEIELTREKFEELAMPLFERTIEIVDRCIRNIDLSKNHIDEIILAGGSTRIPKIQELLSTYFDGKQLITILHPEECVAKGAALQAAMLSESSKQKIKRFTVTEVTSSSLGIGDVANKMDFIIKKNTKIPTSGTVTHATIHNEQKGINLKIYEGERMFVKKNVCLGNFKITDLTPAPPGKCRIKITMSIDLNGILTVTAKEVSTNNTKDLQIAYTKVNRTVLESDEISEAEVRKEEERFAEYAKMHQFLVTYVAAIDYNFKNKKIAAHDMEVLHKSKRIQKKIMEMEYSHDITNLSNSGYKLKQLCEPIIKRYNFKEMPRSREIEKKFENMSVSDDNSDDEQYQGTRKVEDNTRFPFRR